jgi:hypothetical protein
MNVSDGDRQSLVILIILFVIGIVLSIFFVMGSFTEPTVTPLLQLPTDIHFFVFGFVIPSIAGLFTVLILPRLILPLFLATKRVTNRKYKDAYVSINPSRLNLKRWLGRAILVSLLVIGLIAVLVNLVDPQLFMPAEQYADWLEVTDYPQYTPAVVFTLVGIISPVALGLWTVSWMMEDAGIVHYNLPDSMDEKAFVVEPVYLRYKDFLKGYAGLSSLLFIISIFFIFWSEGGSYETALFTLVIPLYSMLQTIPGYLLYSKLNIEFLRKGLPQVGKMNEDDLKLSYAE